MAPNDPPAAPADATPNAATGRPLMGTVWGLAELGGARVLVPADVRAPYIRLLAAEGGAAVAVEGWTGCNRLRGGYSVGRASGGGAELRFTPAATTRMACRDSIATAAEAGLLAALAAAARAEVRGDTLALHAAAPAPGAAPLARFVGRGPAGPASGR